MNETILLCEKKSSDSFTNANHILDIYILKKDLVLNNLQ